MDNRTNGLIGITAVTISTLTIIIMAELRTDSYNHFHKAISELGSIDAPNKWIFNTLCYIVPGILISIFGLNLLKAFRSDSVKPYPFYLLSFSGLCMSVAGFFPANMDNRTSISSIVHSMGSLGGGILWLFCALTLWWQLKKNKVWNKVAIITFIIPFLMVVAMSLVSENTPGISQRIAFAANYLFIVILAIQLLSAENKN